MCKYCVRGHDPMPDFDGTGPLHRGRIIGRGLRPCDKVAHSNRYRRTTTRETLSDSPAGKNPHR